MLARLRLAKLNTGDEGERENKSQNSAPHTSGGL